jgi:serine protease
MVTLWLAALTLATPVRLMDGARARTIEPIDRKDLNRAELDRVERGLFAVKWRDEASGVTAPAFVGRRAVARLDGDSLPSGVRAIRPLLPSLGWWLVESSDLREDGLQLAARLQASGFRGALPDLYFARTHSDFAIPPNDPKYPGQWFFAKIDMESAWKISSGSPDVTVAVIDDGCDLMHPDLVDKLDPGRNSIQGTDDPSFAPNVSGNAHGTACAGLVGASTNNGVGVAGACPGCRLRCVKLLDDSGQGLIPYSADMDAFQFVFDSGAAVASNSWGFTTATPVPQPVADAITMVHDQGRGGLGTLVVFAAGNNNRSLGTDELEAVPGVTTVGAVDNFDELAQFSNYGPPLDVVSPLGTLTTDISGADGDDPGDYTSTFGGTSSACPIVAGIFGLMVSAAPTKTASELEDLLAATAKQSIYAMPDAMGHDDHYGYGLVQPAAALQMLAPPTMKKSSSGGCDVAPGGAPASPLVLVLALALAIGVRINKEIRRSRGQKSLF